MPTIPSARVHGHSPLVARLEGDAVRIERLKEVGRYALGVEWADRHDSILPYRQLRLACPCERCAAAPPPTELPAAAEQPRRLEQLGEESLFIGWADGHDTLLLLVELRALCRCSRCVAEPSFPISGQ